MKKLRVKTESGAESALEGLAEEVQAVTLDLVRVLAAEERAWMQAERVRPGTADHERVVVVALEWHRRAALLLRKRARVRVLGGDPGGQPAEAFKVVFGFEHPRMAAG